MAIRQDQSPKVARQIENTADYYPPATYSGTSTGFEQTPLSYLTYYNELTLNSDALAAQYIPLSAVAQRARNPKIFAIGVIPPSANITGRLLDRTASANGLVVNDSDTLDPIASDNSKGLSGSALPPEFWVEYVQMCGRLKVNPNELAAVINSESGFDPSSVAIRNGKPVAKGLNQIIEKNAGITGISDWSTFEDQSARQQLPAVEAYFAKCGVQGQDRTGIYAKNFGGYSNPNGSRYASLQFINSYQPEADRVKFAQPEYQDVCYKQNAGLDKDGKGFISTADLTRNAASGPPSAIRQRIADAQAFLASGQSLASPVGADSNADKFHSKGSKQAGAARQIQQKTANSPLTADDIANQFTAAQRAQITVVQKALEAMQNTPPLRMLVNPSSFSVKGEKIVSDSGWSRNGQPIIEHWGNQQEKISASGKVAGFYALDANNAVGPGLTRMARNFSQAWQNFQSLVLFYSNNGGIYTRDVTTASEERNLTLMGSIYIFYDDILYIGSFDSLTVSETDTTPFTVEYSFEFTVRAAFLLDNPNPNDKGSVQQANTKPVTTAAAFSR